MEQNQNQKVGQSAMPVRTTGGAKWKQWFSLFVVLVLLGGGVYLFGQSAKAPSREEAGDTTLSTGATKKVGPSLSWEFAPAGTDAATGAPETKVMLMVNGKLNELGIATGSCSILDGSGGWPLADGEVTGVICYFAGAGEEYGVFHEVGEYVVKKGVVEEGSSEEPGLRGEYNTLFTI
ncbi:MAG: hypothetical protein WBK28_00965 [Minisyncoccia bacterium]